MIQHVQQNGLCALNASTTPAMDPAEAATDTTRHPALSAWWDSHCALPRGTRRCAIYIYPVTLRVSGQNDAAP
ncbi:hypothetical protein L9G74_20840, partial [Shewanella sp. C32]|nr:hypothetical protein [Shewanella electrica]